MPTPRTLSFGAALALFVACGGSEDPVSVATVSVSPATATVAIGGTTQLAAATLDGNGTVITGRTVTWSTSNASIATVSGGLVTGVAPGNATISATSEGQVGIAVVSVQPPPVATVTIAPAAPTVIESDTVRLTAVLKATDGTTLTGRTVTWISGTPANATISAAGLVTGVQPGTSLITATSEGKSASVSLTVKISPCNASLATPILSGPVVNGVLEAGDCPWIDNTYADIYSFVLTASTNVEIVMRSTTLDAYLYTFSRDVQGQLVVSGENDDESTTSSDARLTGSLPAGTHYIVANSFAAGSGAYTLQYTAPFAGIAANGFSSSASGNVGAITLERVPPAEAQVLRTLVRQRKRRD